MSIHNWVTLRDFSNNSFQRHLDEKRKRERMWLLRFLNAVKISDRIVKIRFGDDNPSIGNLKEPDFVVEIRTYNSSSMIVGIELVSAYTADENRRTYKDPASSLSNDLDSWSATAAQWESAIRLEVAKKLIKYYSKEHLHHLQLVVCDETNGKDSLVSGHRYIEGNCYYLEYQDGLEFTRANSIRKSGDGLDEIKSSKIETVYVLTKNAPDNKWVSLRLDLALDVSSLSARVCSHHPYKYETTAFGVLPFSGVVSTSLLEEKLPVDLILALFNKGGLLGESFRKSTVIPFDVFSKGS